jgi:hypothetical protein
MRTVETEIDRLKRKQDELMGKNQQLMNSNNALARSWNYMKNRLAFYFTVGASTAFVKNLIEVRSQYEMNERALGILIDSAERGTQIFSELSQMALVSPYTLIELSTAAKQLSAYDVAAKDLVDTTRRLADISAAVGLPVERLTTALGQIKAFEHLTSMTARRFSSAGIPLIKALADHYTELEGKMVSVADVYDRMKKNSERWHIRRKIRNGCHNSSSGLCPNSRICSPNCLPSQKCRLRSGFLPEREDRWQRGYNNSLLPLLPARRR